MKSFKNSLIALLLLTGANVFAQNSDANSKYYPSVDRKALDMNDNLFGEVKPDYKIISSNRSYIELEYYPAGIKEQKY